MNYSELLLIIWTSSFQCRGFLVDIAKRVGWVKQVAGKKQVILSGLKMGF